MKAIVTDFKLSLTLVAYLLRSEENQLCFPWKHAENMTKTGEDIEK